MLYEVKITCYEYGKEKTYSFRKEVSTLDELKTSFLKRFGNLGNVPNKALKEKPLVKQLTYSAKSVEEWVKLVNERTWRWKLNIRELRRK